MAIQHMNTGDFPKASLRIERSTITLAWKRRSPASQTSGEDDDEWLQVYGRVECPDGAWNFVDACLTVREVHHLAAALQAGRACEVEFIEPCLHFVLRAGEDKDLIDVSVRFIGEAAPPWIMGDADRVWQQGWTLRGVVEKRSLRQFGEALLRLVS